MKIFVHNIINLCSISQSGEIFKWQISWKYKIFCLGKDFTINHMLILFVISIGELECQTFKRLVMNQRTMARSLWSLEAAQGLIIFRKSKSILIRQNVLFIRMLLLNHFWTISWVQFKTKISPIHPLRIRCLSVQNTLTLKINSEADEKTLKRFHLSAFKELGSFVLLRLYKWWSILW